MQVKVFETTDMATGLKLVKKELGPEALILSTRKIKNGKLGLLGKHVLEITAAIDTPWPQNQDVSPDDHIVSAPTHEHQLYTNNAALSFPPLTNDDRLDMSADSFRKIGKRSKRQSYTEEKEQPRPENNQMRQEFDELKTIVRSLADEISRLNRRQNSDESPVLSRLSTESASISEDRSSDQARILEMLLSYGTSRETAATIARYALDNLDRDAIQDRQRLHVFLQNTIADIIEVSPVDFHGSERQLRLALVGPTGVGKTTTLAKIAAGYLGNYSNSVALITIDTYRIAAVEQLKVYGEIMHLPVDVVLSPEQLEQAIERHQDKDLILIDTAGRSPRDTLSIDEAASFLRPELAITKHLVLSAATREDELAETITRFSRLGIDYTIFTKVDECINLGIILNTQIHNSAPISYITNGQRVPEDLIAADKNRIAQLIIPNPEGIVHD